MDATPLCEFLLLQAHTPAAGRRKMDDERSGCEIGKLSIIDQRKTRDAKQYSPTFPINRVSSIIGTLTLWFH
jgi:hypothetical protein